MPNTFFSFKSFTVHQDRCAMKVTTDGALFGAWVASRTQSAEQLLDVGAGTGILSLMIAQSGSGTIDAIEVESTCHQQLCDNIVSSEWSDRIHPIHADFNSFEPQKKYDCVVSNPPFHRDQLSSTNPSTNLARHDTGLTIQELLKKSSTLVTPTGRLFVLIPYYRTEEIIACARQLNWQLASSVFVQQTPKHVYFRTFLEFEMQKTTEVLSSSILIKDEKDAYSPEFMALLCPYYLAF